MSKGSKSRITNQKTFNQGWDRIFNKSEDQMSSKNDFIEQQQDSINEEWSCYCNEINSIRHKYGLDSKVFTPNDKEKFAISYIESHLI
jgi:DNA-binding transcriptional regulator YiaG